MESQTVEATSRTTIEPCEPLASVARELGGRIEPTCIFESDKNDKNTREWASRACVVRWPEGPAIYLRMDGEQMAASPNWPDLMTCEGARFGQPVEMRPCTWRPSVKLAASLSTVRVSGTRPPRDQARDIVRRLVIELTKAWPEVMEEHALVTAYQEARRVAAATAREIEAEARTALAATGRAYGCITPNGEGIDFDIRGLPPAQARRLVAFIRDGLCSE